MLQFLLGTIIGVILTVGALALWLWREDRCAAFDDEIILKLAAERHRADAAASSNPSNAESQNDAKS